MTNSEYTPARVKALTHLQRIAAVEERLDNIPTTITPERREEIMRAALTSAQSRAYAAERQVERLTAELAAVRAQGHCQAGS